MSEMTPNLLSGEGDCKKLQSDVYAALDESDWNLSLSFNKPRHLQYITGIKREEHTWRLKEKYKTHCVALVLCLNVGVDPPDVVKTQPCARLECWIDPLSMSSSKAVDNIGRNLQVQYERWQPRARYKQSLDPTTEEVKKLCCSLRRNAKDERVLFHYNGHGVPKPTSQGEIWVFNKAYTQYIPLSMYDLQTWMGAPSLYVYDCSNAGVILEHFKIFAEQHEKDFETNAKSSDEMGSSSLQPVSYKNCLQLGACAVGQNLPMNAELPADLFTSCLTTPVKMAMRWFVLRSRTRVTPTDLLDLIDKIPGYVTDRRTMLGELNWIFTAITDTIAWNSLPAELFQQLFRADLLTASLYRNFLLADRIMRCYNCTPVSSPALPSLANHPLWQAWDQTLDLALAQLPGMLGKDAIPYQHSPFFREQLTAFQVWLDLGSPRRAPPDQLPMVLQVLLSTIHRVRALQTLCRFLALGDWAVCAVLAVGIFPYMLKLLQASAHDLRASMVYIWAKIIAVDPSCQVDLVNAKGHKYFLSVLQDTTVDSEHRTLAAYVLAGIVDNHPAGQEAALQGSMISVCLEQLFDPDPLLRQWLAICLGRLWRDYDAARWSGVRDLAHEKLYPLLEDPHPEVRAACVFALGTFAQPGRERTEHANTIDQQVAVSIAKRVPLDASAIVRAEILAALQWLVVTFEPHFIAVSVQEKTRQNDKYTVVSERRNNRSNHNDRSRVDPGQEALEAACIRITDHVMRKVPSSSSIPAMAASLPTIGFGSVYMKMWSTLCTMTHDPHPQVSKMASEIVNYIRNQLDTVGRDFVEVRGPSGYCGSSASLPPSPNTRSSYMVHANDHTRTLPAVNKKTKSCMPNTISEDFTSKDVSSQNCVAALKRPIVNTEYVQWASDQFNCCSREDDWNKDDESKLYQERRWRYARNKSLRKESRTLRSAPVARLESQAFHSRCPLPPAVILFHPYDQHIAVASKDNFGIWDWGTGAKLTSGSWKRQMGRITSLAYVNSHDHALLAVASHSGAVGVFKPKGSGQEPKLLTAWRGLDVRPAADYRPPAAQPLYSLAQLVSEQFMGSSSDEKQQQYSTNKSKTEKTSHGGNSPMSSSYSLPPQMTLLRWCNIRHTMALAGDSPHIRLWDAQKELKLLDIDTDRNSAATSLWRCGGEGEVDRSSGEELLVGFGDGSVCTWDERTPTKPIYINHDHTTPVICARLRQDIYTLVTGCASGEVCLYDTRKRSLIETVRAPGPLAAIDVHPLCNLLACGSLNQCIGIYDLRGTQLNMIKFHEGFMGARIGPISCLTFHPLRCAMAVGAKDSTVSVYVADAKR